MNVARFGLAALAALAFLLVSNVVLYPVVFPEGSPDAYRYMRNAPIAAYHFLALLVTAALLSFVYPKGYRGGVPWAEGLRFGMMMGVLTSLPMSLHVYAKAEVPLAGLLTGVLWTVITWGISGGLIGAVYGGKLPAE